MLSFRVSHLDMFREWEENEEAGLQQFLSRLNTHSPTEDMLRGTAFHSALETLIGGEVDELDANGFSFRFDGDYEIPDAKIKEIRCHKNYCGIDVSGQVDGIYGKHIIDHKAATWFDAERYFKKYAWRYYLDIFNVDRFTWYVWEMQEDEQQPRSYVVRDLHILEQYRYPDIERDCKALAMRMKLFAEQYLVTETV